jgi:pimeloyl-ACP methyl ester carboxylesterase
MENIKHSHVEVKGLKLHVAEIGTGTSKLLYHIFFFLIDSFPKYYNTIFVFSGEKAVVFLHGFPEIWYTWRHQMIAVANAGYRAIAFDFRGYGLSEHPAEPEKATLMDLVHEVKDLLDSLGINKVRVKIFHTINFYFVHVYLLYILGPIYFLKIFFIFIF